MSRQYINNVINLKGVTIENEIRGFQPQIVLEMFDKEHASLGVGIVMGFSGLSAISGFRFSSK